MWGDGGGGKAEQGGFRAQKRAVEKFAQISFAKKLGEKTFAITLGGNEGA